MLRKLRVVYEWAKKFFIVSVSKRPTTKKFSVIREVQISSPRQNSTATGSTNSGRFKNMTKTRPTICPICRTSEASRPGNISRRPDERWECKECGNHWRS
jgi:transposase-like protein